MARLVHADGLLLSSMEEESERDKADMGRGTLELPTVYTISDLLPDINMTNSTSLTEEILYSPYFQHSLDMAAVFVLAYLFIFLLCMMGNSVVCLTVLRNRHMWTVTNVFILNLSISDLLVGIFCIPTTLVDNLITGWPFSDIICKLSGLVQGMSVCASVFTLVAIAVDRFRCVVYPFKPKLTLIVAKAIIGMIWLLALVIMFPSALMLTVQQEQSHFMIQDDNYNLTYPLYSCYETWPEPEMRKVYTTVLFAHIYLIPLILIILMYGGIGAKLYSTTFLVKVNQTDGTPQGKSPISCRKIKVIKMLIVVALLFMLSWLPLWTLMLLTDYARPEGDQLDLLTGYIFPLSHWLAFSNSSVNPIIYGYYNKNFRQGFRAVWMQRPSCCLDKPSQVCLRRVKRGNKTCTRLDKALSSNTLNLGVRNKIYTDNDLTGCVRLEMEHRRVSKETRSSGAEGGNRGTAIKRELLEDIERISPTGPTAYQAWEL
ncbi:neuropeptide FF receptor 1 like 3 isoform X1 [Pangasianodon hypophthalmus]|uniref:neuropeptide FF receptor 1 like 3 isoform X1 n=2 Tax=Pangasianodon hypophthalmus TaxID=310915 RepID=UPI000EFE7C0F|nr:neuropeptide FF receptor 1 like 3 isoform X1 [Pangasianodon hypophthalmus]XP_053097023.1 neuropeptide FF receptor 1 like 3 isoform X1 [Pangasianodon hypophthalmus]XP_053097024.1 neuropeptide FF receptor 1 like 3 isoform X1 [Pangasianodon hypophthalmus]XP_053097025.1 neuropeptide FF receptor 1 like 3 isoform X1 [Pangasianodon hypophthalmus]